MSGGAGPRAQRNACSILLSRAISGPAPVFPLSPPLRGERSGEGLG